MTSADTGPSDSDVTQGALRRSTDDRVLGGVCGGLGRYFNVDPVWLRLGFVVFTLAGGAGILFYLIAWIVIPAQKAGEVITPRQGRDSALAPMIAGLFLVGLGVVLLVKAYVPWFSDIIWPMTLVAAGIGLIFLGSRK